MLIKPTNPMIKIIKGSMGQQQIESKNQSSPRGMKPFDLGGVGLGIVAALENSCENTSNRIPVNKTAVLRRNLSRSMPIPVKISSRDQTENSDEEEEYTIVTCRDPKESYTKVYTNNGNEHGTVREIHDQSNFRVKNQRSLKAKRVGVFHISPAKSLDFAAGVIPTSDFLSSCNMCRKKLHGLDIYMYRGEKGFCSAECRYKQIVIDERKEKYCSAEASRQVHVDVSSSSPCASGQIFTTGILAS